MHFLSKNKPLHFSLKLIPNPLYQAEQLPPTYFRIIYASSIIQLSASAQCSSVLSAQCSVMNFLLLTNNYLSPEKGVKIKCGLGLSDLPKPFKIVHNVGTGILGVFGAFYFFASLFSQWCHNIQPIITLHHFIEHKNHYYCSANVRFICTSAPWPTL